MAYNGPERRISSSFRRWCHEMWFRHSDEVLDWTGKTPEYTATQYFNQYKWWLKREYQHATDRT